MKTKQTTPRELDQKQLVAVSGGLVVPPLDSDPPILIPGVIIVESFRRLFFTDQP